MSETRIERAYMSSVDCAQGPFELDLPALGTKWGESVSIESYGPTIQGSTVIEAGADNGWTRTVGPFVDRPVNNSRCKLSASEAGPASASVIRSTGSAAPGTDAASAVTKAAPVAFRDAPMPNTYGPSIYLNSSSFPVERLNAVGLSKDTVIKIRFWSTEPNDLRGVTFVVTQKELLPSVPEAEWIAYLQKKVDDAAKEQKERNDDWQKENDKWRAHADECRRQLSKNGCEDVAAGIAQAKEAESRSAHQSFCEKHVDDASCSEVREQIAEYKRRLRLDACRPHPADPGCAEFRDALKTDAANGPPPQPIAEEQPPKPSVNAEWIPGSWIWDGWEFKWTGGGWRVPDSDIRARLTVTAPSAPPPARVEVAIARPVSGSIWVPGAWHWNGGGWVWIGGGWRMPPQVGLRWRPPSWVISSRGVQLDPGRWVR